VQYLLCLLLHLVLFGRLKYYDAYCMGLLEFTQTIELKQNVE
jgi:hypothetical protein